jgi:hypothetical protein
VTTASWGQSLTCSQFRRLQVRGRQGCHPQNLGQTDVCEKPYVWSQSRRLQVGRMVCCS